MSPPRSLASRLVLTGIAFLAVALASIAVSLWVTWQLEGGAAAVNEAGRLRMMTWRMAFDVSTGRRDALAPQAAAFENTLKLLHDGDPSRPLFLPSSDETQVAFSQVRSAWAGFMQAAASSTGALEPPMAVALVESIDALVRSIEHRLAYWTAVLRSFQLTMVGLAVVSAVLLLYTSHLLVLEPLRRLGAAIAALRGGDLRVRVTAPSSQEFRELAFGFNSMAARLASQYATLEETVRRKTADLHAQRERLAALYEVSAFVAKAETLEEMANGFVKLVRRIARADAIALRWSDADNRRYLLLAHEGLPPEFTEQEQCLGTGDCHCGRAPDNGGARVIPIRSQEASRDHCARAGFETLLSVPVSLHHRVHGEIDLFYRTAALSTEIDRSLIELLANHLAGGMEGLRAAAVEKEAAVSSERTLLAQELHDSIAQSLAFLKIQVQLLRAARGRGDEAGMERTLGELDTGVNECMGDVRELLVHFRTRTNAEHIEPALRTTLQKFEHQTGLKTHLEIDGHGLPLDPDVQVQVLHVVQEALSNVRKHAQASQVWVEVAADSAGWRFEVRDDGQGFEPEADRAETHVGLRIMRERAARIGAQVRVDAVPGAGSCVTLTLPPSATAATSAAA